jgi:YidC/Oxa1 family membrane protein insertase
MNFLYIVIISPLIQIMEMCYLFVYRVSDKNPGAALLGVSMAVSTLTLPLYFRAEKWQEIERKTQKYLAPKIAKIKAVFSGDEQYMILSTYYRQNHYHPVYAMRNTFGLIIQVPFFIAAYSYLSHLEILQGSRFLFIHNLGAPDALLTVGTITINIFPVVMTAINCISGAIYTRSLASKEKIQIYGMAVVFLVLLYNSASGLVLYWTMNNIFSLLKNILVKVKHAKKYIYGVLFAGAAFLDVYVLFFHPGDLPKRLLACAIFSIVFFIPLFRKLLSLSADKLANITDTAGVSVIPGKPTGEWDGILSLLIFFLLAGLVIPGSLLASSVEEFSFIESYTSPLPFVFHTFLQAAGIFLFWPICIYLLFPNRTRKMFSLFITVLAFGAFFNVFFANENFGFLTTTLVFSEPKYFIADGITAYFINLAILAILTLVVLYLILSKKKALLYSFQIILLVPLLCFGILNIINIQNRFVSFRDQKEAAADTFTEASCYTLSRTGKNVLLILLDAAISGYVPYIFEEKPELASGFRDFTFYPNCVSFSTHTLMGAPPIYGGYEYIPEEINRRDSIPLAEKHQEAFLLLPRLFSESGYSVTVTDPPFDNHRMSNLSIFAEYPQIHVENISGKYSLLWLNTHPDIQTTYITGLLHDKLIRFSFFKMTPLLLRYFIYDEGDWLTTDNLTNKNNPTNKLTDTFIDSYALMDFLPELTSFTDTGNTYTAIYFLLPHEPALLQPPDYIPSNNVIINPEHGPFANDNRYHVNMTSFLRLEEFFRLLKNEGVYDNTRIILVADHGRGYSDYENNISLPDGSKLQTYHPLLMVKDFYSENNKLKIDNSFMTNADTIFFALKDIVKDPVNPFTGRPLQPQKDNGATIATISAISSHRHTKYKYNIGKNQWMHVHSNIYDPNNWERVEK